MAIDFPTSPTVGQQVTSGSRTWSWSGSHWQNNTITGVQGTQGIQGTQGTQGVQGIQGVQGTQGSQGLQGIQGIQGITGAQGIQGIQGTQGTQGLQGIMGAQGAQGTQGTQGAQGIQGTQGTQGLQGITGAQGISGASILGTNNTWTGTNNFNSSKAIFGAASITSSPDLGEKINVVGYSVITSGSTTSANLYNSAAGADQKWLRFYGSTAGAWMFEKVNDIYTTPTTLMTITSGGNVGIGVTPTQRLDIATASGDCIIRLGNGTSTARFAVDNDGPYIYALTSGDNALRVFTPAGGTAMLIDPSGNVGIGTTSPNAKLEVVGAASVTSFTGSTALGFRITGATSTNDYSGIDFSSSTAIPRARIGSYFAGGGSYLVFGTSNNYSTGITNSAMTIDYNGNVGIGTTSPAGRLHVYTASGSSVAEYLETNQTEAYISFKASGTSSNTSCRIGVTGENLLFLNNGATERMRIDSSGNVGIGTTTPSGKFNVVGVASYDAGINIDGSSISGVGLSLRNAAGNNWYLISTGSGNGGGANNFGFYNGNSGNYLFYIMSTGNVGIGTTSPGYKLEVNGSFAATTKSFIIDHPTKPGMKLRYGSLEGPENGVYVRGKSSSYTIELPDYWTKLVDPESITVQITPYGAPQNIWVSSIADNTVRIASDTPISTYFYFIQAERVDVEKLEVEI
jgi:hypothetical protein